MKRDEESPEVSTGKDVLSGQVPQTESKQDEFAGHTPEPWEVDPAPAVAYSNKSIGDKGYSVLCVMTSMHHGSEVCAVDIETQMPKREAAANARLIAAAPRLLRERDEARRERDELLKELNDLHNWLYDSNSLVANLNYHAEARAKALNEVFVVDCSAAMCRARALLARIKGGAQ